jgi:hypothetical protein
MTVPAHEFAFREFFEDEFTAPCPDLVADRAGLDRAWEVIPHATASGGNVPPQSVNVLPVFISRSHRERLGCHASFFSAQVDDFAGCFVGVDPAARLAPRLVAVAAGTCGTPL